MAKTRHTNSTPTPTKKKVKEKPEKEIPKEVEDNSKSDEIQHICRTCLEEIQESSLIPLNDSSSNIRNELRVCIPEVDFDLVPNAGMCTYCLNALHVAYEFKQKCLQTEDKIRKQLHRKLWVDLSKLKKTNNMVQISNGEGLGLDVVYINEPIEIIDGEIEPETQTPLASSSKAHTSTPALDEEIEMINSFININGNELIASPVSVQEVTPNKFLCNDDELNDDVIIIDEPTTKDQENNLLLGLSESAPRKSSSSVNKKLTKMNNATQLVIKPSKTDTSSSKEPDILSSKRPGTSSSNEVKENVSKTNDYSVFPCKLCKKSFTNSSTYIMHVKQQHVAKLFNCNRCSFKSNYAVGFLLHIKHCKKEKLVNKDNVKKSKTTNKSVSKEYKCEKCEFVTSVLSQYKSHSLICTTAPTKHTKTPNKKKLIVTKNDIKLKPKNAKVSSVDTVDKVHTSFIPNKFGDLNNLFCRFCEFSSLSNVEFENHTISNHQTLYPFSCRDKDCYCLFKTKTLFIRHMMQHYGNKPFRCTHCSYQSITKASLLKHMIPHRTKKNKK